MSHPAAEIAELARLVEAASGNVVPPGHYPFLAEIAQRRAQSANCPDLATYVRALGAGQLPGEWAALLPFITIKESFCFRTPQHFARLQDTLLPRLAAARAGVRRLRVWSAGCARGEEPVTLAIVLAEARELAGWDWQVLASDVDQEALAVAARGVFSERAVAQVPPPLLERYFTARDGGFAISPSLHRRIDYRLLNLVTTPLATPSPSYDLIMLRNVLIYFSIEAQRRVVAAVARALAPDGILLVGPAETLWQLTDTLEPEDLGDCFCYRHAAPTPAPRDRPAARPASRRPPPHRPAPAPPDARMEGKQRPPGRGSGKGEPTAPPPASQAAPSTRQRLAVAAEHLLANRTEEAARWLKEALAADPTDATAHALEGLLHDISGQAEQAVASYRAALYLEPALFQARLLLADALRRAGHPTRAQREYRQVLTALAGPRARDLRELAPLPLPDRAAAAQRARAALAPPGADLRPQTSGLR